MHAVGHGSGMVIFIVVWALAAGSYVLFAGQFSPDELAAAAACGLVAALWSASLRRVATVRFRFEKGTLSACTRAVVGVPTATAKVGRVLARAIVSPSPAETAPGEVVRESFIHGRRRDPADAGRRAVAVLARSLAADSFVVRTPEAHEEVEVHQLAEGSAAKDARWAI